MTSCPRCGAEVKGTGKRGNPYCQRCTSAIWNKKSGIGEKWWKRAYANTHTRRQYSRVKAKPVTLPKIGEPK